MHHLILGYGYCGYYLAKYLLEQGQTVTAISRRLDKDLALSELNHQAIDLSSGLQWLDAETILYYLIPPPNNGKTDSFLAEFLQSSQLGVKKIVYFGSSAVYGDQQGQWVDETTCCNPNNDRALRRLHAEGLWLNYSQKKGIPCNLLRVAGIYGPNRLPVSQAQAHTPLIKVTEAPISNLIFVKDLVRIAVTLGQMNTSLTHFNVADGNPQPMGQLQRLVSQALNITPAPEESWADAFENASAMKKEFMQSSKRLSIERLQTTLGTDLKISPLAETVHFEIQHYR